MVAGEFQEVAHSGGHTFVTLRTETDGTRTFSIGWRHSLPTPAAVFAVWALPQGAAVGNYPMQGIGVPVDPPPVPGCLPVFISSDSEGRFGHQCPSCDTYWRSSGGAKICPYCGVTGGGYEFLTEAQARFVHYVCARLKQVQTSVEDGDYDIEDDRVAETVHAESERPPFYYAEQSQQKRFNCTECGSFNDIIGRYGYCSVCGTRNDLHELQEVTLENIRRDTNERGDHSQRLVETVGAFDTFVRQYVRQVVNRIPMRSARKGRLEKASFHNLENTAAELKAACDIDILGTLGAADRAFAVLMFHRRHVYEHNGGVADEKYLQDSGDAGVRLHQHMRETQEDAHRLIGLVSRMAKALHLGFHDIFPPEAFPIQIHRERQDRKARAAARPPNPNPPKAIRRVLSGKPDQ